MVFDIITIFPDFFTSMLKHGVLHRALDSGKVEVRIHNLRDFTDDAHRSVDDRPFGGGPGMVFKPEPIFRAVESIAEEAGGAAFPVILLSPQGRLPASALSGQHGLLDFPQYTRPAEFRGLRVPEVLLSGNHEEIRRWRRRQALETTWRKRPGLLENCVLSDEDRRLLEEAKRAALDPVTR